MHRSSLANYLGDTNPDANATPGSFTRHHGPIQAAGSKPGLNTLPTGHWWWRVADESAWTRGQI
jgi:hypothetical protein